MATKDLIRKRDRSHEGRGLVPTSGFDLLPQFQREMNKLFGDFFGDRNVPSLWSDGGDWRSFTPSVDIHDDGKVVRIEAELPGLDEKDIDLELNGRFLTLRGEKREEKDESEEGWHKVERRFGSFVRTIELPEGINYDEAKAEYRKGLLRVTLPRKEELRSERRKISLSSEDEVHEQKKAA